MPRIYLDAAPVIYTVQTVAPYCAFVDAYLNQPGVVGIVSELTRLECRVHPLKFGDPLLLKEFDDYFTYDISEIVNISRTVIDRATEIRAQFNIKTVDAIHLAAALESACDIFLTGDRRLASFTGITIEVV